jgi:hypothetical protein
VTRPRKPVQERNVAYHEAGHFVALCALLSTPHKATIEPDGEMLGYVRDPFFAEQQFIEAHRLAGDMAKARATFHRVALVHCAGATAESILDRKAWGYRPGGTDWQNVTAAASALTGKPADGGDVLPVFLECTTILRCPPVWAAVEYVAAQLLERRTIEGSDVYPLADAVGEMLKGLSAPRYDALLANVAAYGTAPEEPAPAMRPQLVHARFREDGA